MGFQWAKRVMFFSYTLRVTRVRFMRVSTILSFLFTVTRVARITSRLELFFISFKGALASFFVVLTSGQMEGFIFLRRLIMVARNFVFFRWLLFGLLHST